MCTRLVKRAAWFSSYGSTLVRHYIMTSSISALRLTTTVVFLWARNFTLSGALSHWRAGDPSERESQTSGGIRFRNLETAKFASKHCCILTGRNPSLLIESMTGSRSIIWNNSAPANFAFTTSGIKELTWPTDCPQKAIAKNTLKVENNVLTF